MSPSDKEVLEAFIKLEKQPKQKRPNSDQIHLADEKARKAKLENDSNALDQELRKKIFKWVQWLVSLYLAFVGIVLVCNMIGNFCSAKNLLSEKVFIALLTTTTVNVIGLPYLIIKALFQKR